MSEVRYRMKDWDLELLENANTRKLNDVMIRRKNKVSIKWLNFDEPNDCGVPFKEFSAFFGSFLKNIQSYGYTLSDDLIRRIWNYKGCTKAVMVSLIEIEKVLRRLSGADVTYKVMYPNFPEQVMEAYDEELFVNAIVHYISDGKLVPHYPKTERMPLLGDYEYTVLDLASLEEPEELMRMIAYSKTSLSKQDVEDFKVLFNSSMTEANDAISEPIPYKENAAIIAASILNAPNHWPDNLRASFKTPTDVLRLITAVSDGDVSLAENSKFKNLSRPKRRFIMDLLAEIMGKNKISALKDFRKYREKWLRVGEVLHPFEFKAEKYASVRVAFMCLRENVFSNAVKNNFETYMLDGHYFEAFQQIQSKPGELARHLDVLLRNIEDKQEKSIVLKRFRECAKQVPVYTLMQMMCHFKSRWDDEAPRVFFPKGQTAKVYVIEDNRKPIEYDDREEVVEILEDAIRTELAIRPDFGKIYVDKSLKSYLVPFSQRSASKTSKTVVRGSRFKIRKKTNVLRTFIWWTNGSTHSDESRIDIDLSCTIFDENLNEVNYVSYTNLRDDRAWVCHSGDIVNGGPVDSEGVAEFIDVSLPNLPENYRYLVFDVKVFCGPHFSDMTNCRFGWMEREDLDSGEIFEPKTVKMNMDVTANRSVEVPIIYDALTHEIIWCDLTGDFQTSYAGCYWRSNQVENDITATKARMLAMLNMNKPNVYDLVYQNGIVRGGVTSIPTSADVIFTDDPEHYKEKYELKDGVKFITPFDTEYIASELL